MARFIPVLPAIQSDDGSQTSNNEADADAHSEPSAHSSNENIEAPDEGESSAGSKTSILDKRSPDRLIGGASIDAVFSHLDCEAPIYKRTMASGDMDVHICVCRTAIVCGAVGASVAVKRVSGPLAINNLVSVHKFNTAIRQVAGQDELAMSLNLAEYPVLVQSPITLFTFSLAMPTDLLKNTVSLASTHRLSAREIEFQIACIMRDVIFGVMLVHKAGYVHGDIKPGNILLTHEGLYPDNGKESQVNVESRARLIDFDGSAVIENGTAQLGTCTKAYGCDSELCTVGDDGCCTVTTAYDVYSIGVVAYNVYAPLANASRRLGVVRSYSSDGISLQFFSNTSPAFREFVFATRSKTPEKRLTLEEMLRHPFLVKHLVIPGYTPPALVTISGLISNAASIIPILLVIGVIAASIICVIRKRRSQKARERDGQCFTGGESQGEHYAF